MTRSLGHQGRVDINHMLIVEALRKAGCTVQSLTSVGGGCPDLAVGRAGRNYFLEVKQPDGVLTPDQVVWHQAWNGQVATVRDVTIAFAAVGLGKSKR